MRFLKWPALLTLYFEMSGASQADVARHMTTFKAVATKTLELMFDTLSQLATMVQAM